MVLLGQQFRRRHQTRLRFRRHGEQHRIECDHRLARTHITLHEPIRGHTRRKILGDLLDHLFLIFRQREGKALADVLVDARRPLELRRAQRTAQVRSLELHAKLKVEQLVIREAPPRDEHFFFVIRQMLHAIGFAQFRQRAIFAKGLGQMILNQRQRPRHRLLHHPLNRPALE